jgi:hypothetical protein
VSDSLAGVRTAGTCAVNEDWGDLDQFDADTVIGAQMSRFALSPPGSQSNTHKPTGGVAIRYLDERAQMKPRQRR